MSAFWHWAIVAGMSFASDSRRSDAVRCFSYLPGRSNSLPKGKVSMPGYRAYKIKNDHADGAPTIITCDSDQQAIEAAKVLADGHDVELWDGARFVIGIRAGEAR
jgi:hypothetical protein